LRLEPPAFRPAAADDDAAGVPVVVWDAEDDMRVVNWGEPEWPVAVLSSGLPEVEAMR
jgi:hypothetical protein